jgi:SAM-dependent methyltransferase
VSFTRYEPERAPASSASGWDAWAGEYAQLGETNAGYALGKRLLHEIVERFVSFPVDRRLRVLDFNCGAGEDVGRFLARGCQVVGCDGSPGMLHEAAVRNAADLASGRLELWLGQSETLAPASFGSRSFDLIFSAVGGFAYLDDAMFVQVHRVLAGMLAPGGVMILAHLTPFCLADSVYYLSRLSPRAAVKRWRGVVPIEVRGQSLTMHLRSARRIRALLAGHVPIDRVLPLLVCTPPFQTGFRPTGWTASWLQVLDRAAIGFPSLSLIADQVVCIVNRPDDR